jgi:hypothetical protein
MVQWARSGRRVVLATSRFFVLAAKGFSVIVFRAFSGAVRAAGVHRYHEGIHG